MAGVRLAYLTFIARDVAALAQFYIDALGLEEVLASRDERYREVKGGGAMIGFAYQGVYAMMDMTGEENPTGTRSIASFDMGDAGTLTAAMEWAVVCGAVLVKAPFDTHFGQRLGVLRDPEGNIIRLTARLAQ